MKKAKIIMPLLAFVFAVASAFAFKTKEEAVWKRYAPGTSDCIEQNECTTTGGAVCDFIPLDQDCAVDLLRTKN